MFVVFQQILLRRIWIFSTKLEFKPFPSSQRASSTNRFCIWQLSFVERGTFADCFSSAHSDFNQLSVFGKCIVWTQCRIRQRVRRERNERKLSWSVINVICLYEDVNIFHVSLRNDVKRQLVQTKTKKFTKVSGEIYREVSRNWNLYDLFQFNYHHITRLRTRTVHVR